MYDAGKYPRYSKQERERERIGSKNSKESIKRDKCNLPNPTLSNHPLTPSSFSLSFPFPFLPPISVSMSTSPSPSLSLWLDDGEAKNVRGTRIFFVASSARGSTTWRDRKRPCRKGTNSSVRRMRVERGSDELSLFETGVWI